MTASLSSDSIGSTKKRVIVIDDVGSILSAAVGRMKTNGIFEVEPYHYDLSGGP